MAAETRAVTTVVRDPNGALVSGAIIYATLSNGITNGDEEILGGTVQATTNGSGVASLTLVTVAQYNIKIVDDGRTVSTFQIYVPAGATSQVMSDLRV
jgi:hypothetical protein